MVCIHLYIQGPLKEKTIKKIPKNSRRKDLVYLVLFFVLGGFVAGLRIDRFVLVSGNGGNDGQENQGDLMTIEGQGPSDKLFIKGKQGDVVYLHDAGWCLVSSRQKETG